MEPVPVSGCQEDGTAQPNMASWASLRLTKIEEGQRVGSYPVCDVG